MLCLHFLFGNLTERCKRVARFYKSVLSFLIGVFFSIWNFVRTSTKTKGFYLAGTEDNLWFSLQAGYFIDQSLAKNMHYHMF